MASRSQLAKRFNACSTSTSYRARWPILPPHTGVCSSHGLNLRVPHSSVFEECGCWRDSLESSPRILHLARPKKRERTRCSTLMLTTCTTLKFAERHASVARDQNRAASDAPARLRTSVPPARGLKLPSRKWSFNFELPCCISTRFWPICTNGARWLVPSGFREGDKPRKIPRRRELKSPNS